MDLERLDVGQRTGQSELMSLGLGEKTDILEINGPRAAGRWSEDRSVRINVARTWRKDMIDAASRTVKLVLLSLGQDRVRTVSLGTDRENCFTRNRQSENCFTWKRQNENCFTWNRVRTVSLGTDKAKTVSLGTDSVRTVLVGKDRMRTV